MAPKRCRPRFRWKVARGTGGVDSRASSRIAKVGEPARALKSPASSTVSLAAMRSSAKAATSSAELRRLSELPASRCALISVKAALPSRSRKRAQEAKEGGAPSKPRL